MKDLKRTAAAVTALMLLISGPFSAIDPQLSIFNASVISGEVQDTVPLTAGKAEVSDADYVLGIAKTVRKYDSLKSISQYSNAYSDGNVSGGKLKPEYVGKEKNKVIEVPVNMLVNAGVNTGTIKFDYDSELTFIGCLTDDKGTMISSIDATMDCGIETKKLLINNSHGVDCTKTGTLATMLFMLPEDVKMDHEYPINFVENAFNFVASEPVENVVSGIDGYAMVTDKEADYVLDIDDVTKYYDSLKTVSQYTNAYSNGAIKPEYAALEKNKVIEVPVEMIKNAGVNTATIKFDYDPDLTLLGCLTDENGTIESIDAIMDCGISTKKLLINNNHGTDCVKTGTLATLLFILPENVKMDYKYKVNFVENAFNFVASDPVENVVNGTDGYAMVTKKPVSTDTQPTTTSAKVTTTATGVTTSNTGKPVTSVTTSSTSGSTASATNTTSDTKVTTKTTTNATTSKSDVTTKDTSVSKTTSPTSNTTVPTESSTVPTSKTTVPTESSTVPTSKTTLSTSVTTVPTSKTTSPTSKTTVTSDTLMPVSTTTVTSKVTSDSVTKVTTASTTDETSKSDTKNTSVSSTKITTDSGTQITSPSVTTTPTSVSATYATSISTTAPISTEESKITTVSTDASNTDTQPSVTTVSDIDIPIVTSISDLKDDRVDDPDKLDVKTPVNIKCDDVSTVEGMKLPAIPVKLKDFNSKDSYFHEAVFEFTMDDWFTISDIEINSAIKTDSTIYEIKGNKVYLYGINTTELSSDAELFLLIVDAKKDTPVGEYDIKVDPIVKRAVNYVVEDGVKKAVYKELSPVKGEDSTITIKAKSVVSKELVTGTVKMTDPDMKFYYAHSDKQIDLTGFKVTADIMTKYDNGETEVQKGVDITNKVSLTNDAVPSKLYNKTAFKYAVDVSYTDAEIAPDGVKVGSFDVLIGQLGDITLNHEVDVVDSTIVLREAAKNIVGQSILKTVFDETKPNLEAGLIESVGEETLLDFMKFLGNAYVDPEGELDVVDSTLILRFAAISAVADVKGQKLDVAAEWAKLSSK